MRVTFKNISVPTRAAKRLKSQLSLKEHLSRHWTAQVLGYASWHELNHAVGMSPKISSFDEDLSAEDLRARRTYQAGRLAACIRKEGLALQPAEVLAAWRPSAARPQENPDEVLRPETWAAWGGEGRFLALLNTIKVYAPPNAATVEAELLRGIRNTRAHHLLSVCAGLAVVYCLTNDVAEERVGRRLLEALAARGHYLSMYTLSVILKHSSSDADRLRAFSLLRKLVTRPGTPSHIKENAAKAIAVAQADGPGAGTEGDRQGFTRLLSALRRVRVSVGLDFIAAHEPDDAEVENLPVTSTSRIVERYLSPENQGAIEAANHLSFLLTARGANEVEPGEAEDLYEEGVCWLNTEIHRQRRELSERWGNLSDTASAVFELMNLPKSDKDNLIAEMAVYKERARLLAPLSADIQERLAAEKSDETYKFSEPTRTVYSLLNAKYGRAKTILVGRTKKNGDSLPFIVSIVGQGGAEKAEHFASEPEVTDFLTKLLKETA